MHTSWIYLLLLTFTPSASAWALPALSGAPIDLSCPKSRNLGPPEGTEAAKNTRLEYLKDRFSEFPEVVKLSNQMIKETKGSDSYPAHALKLASMISNTDRDSESGSCSKYPALEVAVRNLQKKYPTRSSRAASAESYLADLEKVLTLTDSGKRLLACFKAPADPTVFKSGHQYLSPREAAAIYGYKGAGTMSYVGLKDRSGKRTKSIIYDLDSSPLVALFLLAHEMQHGCDAESVARNADQWRATVKTGSESAGKRTYDLNALSLEARGYLAAELTFEEFAKKIPHQVCNQAYVSSFYDGEVLTLADYYGYIQNTIESGEFSRWQALDYAESGLYDFDSVLEQGVSGAPLLKSSVKSKVTHEVQKALSEFK
ncbi:MAG: hypothetical protein EBX52_05405 [Proteobacteria bacterium]|nr:hypothetical protein [Pseudomonadota bacterium]